MGIKTKFNPMGVSMSSIDPGELSLWRYSNNVIAGKTLLYNYTGSDWNNTLNVPKVGGRSVINDWYYETSSGTGDANRNTPFHNNPHLTSVDLQKVPFRNNSAYNAFYNCINLISVLNIPESVTNMSLAFRFCNNLNQNIQIPNSVTSLYYTFGYCNNLNQNIQIPVGITNLDRTFYYCRNLNQNIQIPGTVKSLNNTFAFCYNLNQNIKIPKSVTNMSQAFYMCANLNQNIQIPEDVTQMYATFQGCSKLNQSIKIPDAVQNMCGTFRDCPRLSSSLIVLSTNLQNSWRTFNNTSLPKDVYIYFTYANGVPTNTYNLVVASTDINYRWDGQKGVTVRNLGAAPY